MIYIKNHEGSVMFNTAQILALGIGGTAINAVIAGVLRTEQLGVYNSREAAEVAYNRLVSDLSNCNGGGCEIIKVMSSEAADMEDRPENTILSDEEKESIYREVERNYAREDAKAHLIDMKGEEYVASVSDETIEDIVNEYFDIHDCNIPENSLWEAAIEYILNE